MTEFKIIGAGMAGLLAGAILRDQCTAIIESQPSVPNNHNALLRFRSSIVGDAVNIPFEPVTVVKAIASIGNPVADAVSYSLKTNGTARLRSIVGATGVPEQRFIAPPDFISRLAKKVSAPIDFGQSWDGPLPDDFFISTIPMPALMDALDYPHEERPVNFGSVIGFVCTAQLADSDFCATVYIPDKSQLAYRASVTKDQLIVEYAFPKKTYYEAEMAMKPLTDYPLNLKTHLHQILELFGMRSDAIVGKPVLKIQPYSKILPVDENLRKRFILWASENHNVYSFGRFATWRPNLLLDALVNDLRVIQRLASGGTSYDARKS